MYIYSLIMYDEVDWGDFIVGPQYILDEDFLPVRVYIGIPHKIDNTNLVGIYVKTEDYERLNHDAAYIFIHSSDEPSDEDMQDIINFIENEIKGNIIVDNPKDASRMHFHIGPTFDLEGEDGKSEIIQ